ncbi:FAD-dependent oxidoreductase [Microvirga sp. GCM10011540]|uniref:FAD-dependent oxidoreductase n=1 Tax=Microvirga sp. GCM10011540 TaxID=3317338 RepID=UPI003605C017
MMERNLPETSQNLLLVGGGHAHVFVLEAFARRPEPGLRLTLVTKDVLTPYSGMLPGHLAGLYERDAMHIDLERLVRESGATLVQDEAIGFDARNRQVRLRNGGEIAYDLLSIDIGITPDLSGIDGAADHALAVKPIGDLLEKWDRLVAAAAGPDGPRRVAIVGGGVAGICLAFAAASTLRKVGGAGMQISVVSAGASPELNSGMQERIRQALKRRRIALYANAVAVGVDERGVTLADGSLVPADAVLVSTGAAPPPALNGSDLAKDERGFLAVGPSLQVLNDSSVFAAGDCATMMVSPRPKAGVFAVRQGPVLARNLRRVLRGEPLEFYTPQHDHLILIGTGDGRAIGGRGRWLSFEGRWVWRWKDWIDRRFMRRFR